VLCACFLPVETAPCVQRSTSGTDRCLHGPGICKKQKKATMRFKAKAFQKTSIDCAVQPGDLRRLPLVKQVLSELNDPYTGAVRLADLVEQIPVLAARCRRQARQRRSARHPQPRSPTSHGVPRAGCIKLSRRKDGRAPGTTSTPSATRERPTHSLSSSRASLRATRRRLLASLSRASGRGSHCCVWLLGTEHSPSARATERHRASLSPKRSVSTGTPSSRLTAVTGTSSSDSVAT
jgi:hypothetical protein